MFHEHEFTDRISAATRAGFKAIECQWPYSVPAKALLGHLKASNAPLVLLNAPAGDVSNGDLGLAAIPGREQEFKDSLKMALAYAEALNCPNIHIMSGKSDKHHTELYLENIKWAADLLNPSGRNVLIEPINTNDVPGYFMNTAKQALDIIQELNLENLKLQYDIYHSFQMNEDIQSILSENLHTISHIQISDYPGRHEPGTGEIDYSTLLKLIVDLDYKGWVGCEYFPKEDTAQGLTWRDKW